MISSAQIYRNLSSKDLIKERSQWWWPGAGSFEVIIGAILTQNTTWYNVEKSLHNLQGFLHLDNFLTLNIQALKEQIRPSGFYNQKAPRLHIIAKNIKTEFKTFEQFKQKVDRTWLLNQKGLGKESTDSILNYGCMRDIMVVDSYTKRLLEREYAITFKDYDSYQDYLESGIRSAYPQNTALHFARFHGMIVEYQKTQARK